MICFGAMNMKQLNVYEDAALGFSRPACREKPYVLNPAPILLIHEW